MTSRYITANEDNIIVLENHGGYYAAIRVIDIKDNSSSDSVDELEFEYVILPNKQKDFSKLSK